MRKIIIGSILMLFAVAAAYTQTILPFTSGPKVSGGGGSIIPAARLTTWQPGLSFNKMPASGSAGNTIPSNYLTAGYGWPTASWTQCGSTLTPLGGSSDDQPQVQAAINACTANHFVLLNCGVFNLKSNITLVSYIALRGCGPGKGLSTGLSAIPTPPTFVTDATATQLFYGNNTTGFGPVIRTGLDGVNPGEMEPLSVDMVQGDYSVTLTTAVSGNVVAGTLIRIDQNTDNDPDVYWGNHCFTGAQFNANIVGGTGSVLNVTSMISGYLNPTNFTINSSGNSYVSGTGVITLSTSMSNAYVQGNNITLASLTGSGANLGSLNGTWQVISNTGSTVVIQGPTGQGTITINGGAINGQSVFIDVVGIGRGAAFIDSQLTGTPGGVGTYQMNNTQTLSGTVYATSGCASRSFFSRQDRSLLQIFEVATVTNAGKTITFTTPARHTYCAGAGSCTTTPGVTAGEAQLTTMGGGSLPSSYGVFVEELMIAEGLGSIGMQNCAYCGVKHVETFYSNGAGIGLEGCFRCEVRDSFMHETPQPVQGGGGYITANSFGMSDTLYINNIIWNGDKVQVGQSTGGGNVYAYNYTADAWEYTFPSLPESGLNEAHNTTSKMALFEQNESHEFSGDSFWGNSIDITVLRNNFTMLRPGGVVVGTQAGIAPLNTWMSGGCPYVDGGVRTGMYIQTSSFRHNFVGNIIGFSGQPLLNQTCATQTAFAYEDITARALGPTVLDWYIGEIQCCSGNINFDPNTYLTQLRQGNWSWQLNRQTWYAGTGIGATGSTNTGSPQTIPNSYLYMQGETQPPFYATSSYCPCTWPWVDPTTGTTHTYPAKARWLNGQAGGSYNAL